MVIGNVEGYRFIRAKAFIDATGDAALSDLCGAECKVILRDIDTVAPSTLCSLFAGIDWDDPAYGDDWRGIDQVKALVQGAAAQGHRRRAFLASGPLHAGHEQDRQHAGAAQRRAHVQPQRLDSRRLSDGMMFGRKLAVEYTEFFRKYVPGCEDIELLTTAPVMGVRDSRRIVGEFELTIDDFRAARQFPDQIAVYNRPTDVHPTDTSEKEYERFLHDFHGKHGLGEGDCLGMPYGILVPKGWEKSVGRRPLPLQRHQGARLDPRAVGGLHDGPGVGHRRRAVDPHRPAGLRPRHLDAGGNAARAGRLPAAGDAQP